MTGAASGPSLSIARPGVGPGMACLDTSGNPRIPMLMELVGALSRAREPHEVLHTFAAGVQQLYGHRGYVSLSTRGLKLGEYRVTRLLPDATPEAIAAVDAWSDTQRMPVHRGGFFGDLVKSAYPEIIHHLSLEDDPVFGDALSSFGSLMAIPLFDDGEPANWSITLREDPEGFTVQELEESILRSNLVGGRVKNTVISKQLLAAHDAIQREVDQIAAIQRSLLPEAIPKIAGVELAASYETFDRAGGDYYDFMPMRHRGGQPDPEGPWGLLIADASGHGPAAAVVMAMLQSVLHAYPALPEGPAEVLEHVNRHLCSKRIESSFVTAFFAIFDPATRRLSYARAGHNPPLLMKRSGPGWQMERLEQVGGIPLGIMEETSFEEAAIEMAPGQTLVLYTDGITEARSPDASMFGLAGIERSLTVCTGAPDCVISHVTAALREHEASVRPSDDQTLVVMKMAERD